MTPTEPHATRPPPRIEAITIVAMAVTAAALLLLAHLVLGH